MLARKGISGFSAEYQAVLDYATANAITHPSGAQNTINNAIVVGLVACGAFTEFDNFWYFRQAADLDFKRINWADPNNYYLTDVASTPNNADGGISASATNQALFTNYIPSTDAVKCLKEDSSVIWRFYNLPTTFDVARNIFAARTGNNTQQVYFGNLSNNSILTRLYGSDFSLTNFGSLQLDINSHFHKRDLVANSVIYQDGVLIVTGGNTNTTAGTLLTLNIPLLGYNNNGSTTSSIGAGLAYIGFGSNMDSIQLDIYDAINP